MNTSISFCNHWSISFSETPEHVKNYRPKILLMTGNPAHRPPLVNFGQLVTKNTSLLLCGHVLDDPRPVNIDSLKNNVQLWLKDHKVKTFNDFHEWHSLYLQNIFHMHSKFLFSLGWWILQCRSTSWFWNWYQSFNVHCRRRKDVS